MMFRLWGGFGEDDILVDTKGGAFVSSREFNKIKEDKWRELLRVSKKNKVKIWNGKIYRMSYLAVVGKKLKIGLSKIDYKTHYATDWALDLYEDRPIEERPNGIYVSGYIQTNDDFWILGKRSKGMSVMGGKFSLIGGNLSADEMVVTEGKDLFGAFLKEIEEETGLGSEEVSFCRGLGIYVSNTLRIGMIFYCRLKDKKERIMEKIKVDYEHEKVVFLERKKIEEMIGSETLHSNVTDSFADCLNLVKRVKPIGPV